MATASSHAVPVPPEPSRDTGPARSNEVRRRLILGMNRETSGLIDDLTARTGFDTGELFNVALALLRTCLDAVEEGKPVGVAAGDQELELEFTGFHKNDPAT